MNVGLFVLTFIFTVLSTTDVFPRSIKTDYLIPYVLKAVPCILVWLKVVADQLTMSLCADVSA